MAHRSHHAAAAHVGADAEPHLAVTSPVRPARVPQHVAIIMDGNGRWASQRGQERLFGHEAGTENIRRITFAAGELGIRYLTLWAFSSENWRRPKAEVDGILDLLGRAIVTETDELHRQGAQLRHIGDLGSLSPDLQDAIRGAIHRTRDNTSLVLTLAFNYGGRQELIHAIRAIVGSGVAPEEIDDAMLQRHLYTADLPDPDLIIRTSGEVRLSNFLIWQGAYAELFFCSALWPDFTPQHLEEAVADYASRDRRFGALSEPAPPIRP